MTCFGGLKPSKTVVRKFDPISMIKLSLAMPPKPVGEQHATKKRRGGGAWSAEQESLHINLLELLAAYYALRIYAANMRNAQILFRIDNTTTISCINRMGSVKYPSFNKVSRKIWDFCESRSIYIFASYITSKGNYIADKESRIQYSDTEWSLSDSCFESIIKTYGDPEVDLFASCSNNKCKKYFSWKPDSYALGVDAYTVIWQEFFYAFPPFCLILRTLQKIKRENCTGIVVVPYWESQSWFPLFMELLISFPIIFKPHESMLIFGSRLHPLRKSLSLMAGVLSGKVSNVVDYRTNV